MHNLVFHQRAMAFARQQHWEASAESFAQGLLAARQALTPAHGHAAHQEPVNAAVSA